LQAAAAQGGKQQHHSHQHQLALLLPLLLLQIQLHDLLVHWLLRLAWLLLLLFL
jgi:hypothetical protein